MTDAAFAAAVFVLNPRTGERARRLACAVHLLQGGMPVAEVRLQVRLRFGLAWPVAWRVVDMALDMAGEAPPAEKATC